MSKPKFEEEKKSYKSEEPEISLSDLWNKFGGEKGNGETREE